MSARKFRDTWWVDFSWKHVRHRKRSPINTRAGALEYETLLRGRLARGEPLDPTTRTVPLFGPFAAEWLETHGRTNNRPSTVRSKKQILSGYLVPTFGNFALSDITHVHIERYKAQRLAEGLAPKTINNHLTVLHAALKTAEEWDLHTSTPRIRWLKVPPQADNYLSQEECARLLDGTLDRQCREMILCALRTGMRRGELSALDWRDVDLSQNMIAIHRNVVGGIIGAPKSNRARYVPIAHDLRAVLASRSEPSGLVFPGKCGNIIAECTLSRQLARFCAAVGIRPIGWHLLRHTFASQLVSRGVGIRTVQVLLGHSTVRMTERYAHLAPSSLHDAISVLVSQAPNVIGNLWATATSTPAQNASFLDVSPTREVIEISAKI